jgi:hypothetical protein
MLFSIGIGMRQIHIRFRFIFRFIFVSYSETSLIIINRTISIGLSNRKVESPNQKKYNRTFHERWKALINRAFQQKGGKP